MSDCYEVEFTPSNNNTNYKDTQTKGFVNMDINAKIFNDDLEYEDYDDIYDYDDLERYDINSR